MRINRRQALQTLAIGSIANTIAHAQTKPNQAKELTEVSKLGKDWDSHPFMLGNDEALLVRIPSASSENLKNGRAIKTTLENKDIYLTAYTRKCTHNGCKVPAPSASNNKLTCGCHGAQFDASDGTVLRGPARKALSGIKLEVKDGKVWALGLLN